LAKNTLRVVASDDGRIIADLTQRAVDRASRNVLRGRFAAIRSRSFVLAYRVETLDLYPPGL